MTYKEKKELESMESVIIKTEEEIEKLTERMQELMQENNVNELQKVCINIDILQKELERLYHRWQELEGKK
jgi:ATP-binding cassette subfamily F protein uup